MANEIDVTESAIKMHRGDTQLYTHESIVAQQIDSNATQDNSAAFAATTQMITVVNTGSACRIRVWDAAGTVDATNSGLLQAGERLDIDVSPGQIISSKIV